MDCHTPWIMQLKRANLTKRCTKTVRLNFSSRVNLFLNLDDKIPVKFADIIRDWKNLNKSLTKFVSQFSACPFGVKVNKGEIILKLHSESL